MTNIFDMLTTVIYVAVPAFVGVGLLVVFTRWLVGLWAYTTTAQAEARSAQLEAQYNEALRALDVQQRALRVDLVQPDVNGLLPVTKAAIDQNPRALITLASQYIDSRKALPVMPQQLHYAPHITHAKPDSKALEMAELPQLMQAAQAPPPLDFWKLYHADQLPEQGFLLGFDLETNEPVTADWRKMYSALIGGQSGSGKSTLVRCVLAQAALQGSRFIVIDPHAQAGEESLAYSLQPLRKLMLMPPAADDSQIRSALQFVTQVVRNRLSGQDTDRTPLVLVADELTGMLSRGNVSEELLATLGLIAQESRKVGVYAFGIGQQFQAELFPSSVRNSFVSYLSCRMRKDDARTMSGSNQFAQQTEGLTIGQTVWMTPQGEILRLAVPNCTEHHLELVAKSVGDGRYTVDFPTTSKALPEHPKSPSSDAQNNAAETIGKSSGKGVESDSTTYDAEIVLAPHKIALIRELIKAGKTKAEILREVWGATSGRKYQAASNDYDQIITTIVRGMD